MHYLAYTLFTAINTHKTLTVHTQRRVSMIREALSTHTSTLVDLIMKVMVADLPVVTLEIAVRVIGTDIVNRGLGTCQAMTWISISC